jgi:hypothetical protein
MSRFLNIVAHAEELHKGVGDEIQHFVTAWYVVVPIVVGGTFWLLWTVLAKLALKTRDINANPLNKRARGAQSQDVSDKFVKTKVNKEKINE